MRACAVGDPAAQETVRKAELTDPDVLELLAAAPAEPADRAAYLTLLGQREQRQAMDPDGTLLGLAYWAATGETRGRLRAVLAAEGDGEAVRAVVGAEQRDHVAAMSYDELDHLGRRLAEHGRYDELRRLALDLPLAKAVATARLLPPGERAEGSGDCLVALAGCSPQELSAVQARLPHQKVIRHRKGSAQVSFSLDQTELAISTTELPPETVLPKVLTESVRLVTGESALHHRQQGRTPVHVHSILHLGDEILRMESPLAHPDDVLSRLRPRHESIPVQGPRLLSELGHASTGAVAVTVSGLVFVDRKTVRRRHVAVPRIAEVIAAYGEREQGLECHLATLPEHGLLAFTLADQGHVLVLDEDGTVLHDEQRAVYVSTFLAPDRLAVIPEVAYPQEERYEIWALAESGPARREKGSPRGWAALDELRGCALDAEFARWIVGPGFKALRDSAAPESLRNEEGILLAVSPYGDMFVTSRCEKPLPLSRYEGDRRARCWGRLEVHTPYLPAAREALEQPLLHATPRHWHHIRQLRTKIGDPAVREALGLLDHALTDRFGADIALGSGPAATAGPHDLALGPDRTE